MIFNFWHIKKQKISMYHDNKEIHAIKYCFWVCCTFWALYWHIKSTGKEHLNIFITERFIEKAVSFWDSVKTFRRSHLKLSIKTLFLKILQYSQEVTSAGVAFHLCCSPCNFIKKRFKCRFFPLNIPDILRTTFL